MLILSLKQCICRRINSILTEQLYIGPAILTPFDVAIHFLDASAEIRPLFTETAYIGVTDVSQMCMVSSTIFFDIQKKLLQSPRLQHFACCVCESVICEISFSVLGRVNVLRMCQRLLPPPCVPNFCPGMIHNGQLLFITAGEPIAAST